MADRKDYMSGTTGGSASSPTLDEERDMRPILMGGIAGFIAAHVIGWIPLAGGLATGIITGWVAGTRIRGLYASFVPGIIAMGWYWLVTYLPDLPFVWADSLTPILAPVDFLLYGASGVVFAVVFMGQFALALIGGWIGGAWKERRAGRTTVGRTARPF